MENLAGKWLLVIINSFHNQQIMTPCGLRHINSLSNMPTDFKPNLKLD